MTEVYIGKISCDKKLLDKTDYMSDMQLYNCEIYESCSLVNPVFILMYDARFFGCNYIYVPLWHKYYFMHNPTLTPSGRAIVSCHEDVLMSNKDLILNLDVYVIANQNKRNKLIVDVNYPQEILSTVSNLKFNATPFNVEGGYNTVLSVIGGKLQLSE